MFDKPMTGPIRAAALLAVVGMLSLGSCDLAGNEGGPGASPGLIGAIPAAPSANLALDNVLVSNAVLLGPNSSSNTPSISSDGQFVAFASNASNLVPGDTNGTTDIFVRDTVNGTTERVSVDSVGAEGNSGSFDPYISSDGRYVVFASSASNLAAGDGDFTQDIFWHDRNTGVTELVSVSTGGTKGTNTSERPTVSDDGRYVAYDSFAANLVTGDNNGYPDVFVRDRTGATTTRVSIEAGVSIITPNGVDGIADGLNTNSYSWYACISGDGNFVTFQSYSADVVGGDTNGVPDIFRVFRDGSGAVRISLASGGAQANSYCYANYFTGGGRNISSNGNVIAFASYSNNLTPGDFNNDYDVFVRVISANATLRVSLSTGGTEPNSFSFDGRISNDGTKVAFHSNATTLGPDGNFTQDIFVRDIPSGQTTLVSTDSNGTIANSQSDSPVISGDGTKVAFSSYASNLIVDDTNGTQDVFIHDLASGVTERVSSQSAAGGADNDCQFPHVASGAPIVVFESNATNLIPGGTSGRQVFRRDVLNQTTLVVSVNTGGFPGNGDSSRAVCSADGRFVAFQSDADDLVPADGNFSTDVFVRDMAAGVTTRVSVDSSGLESNAGSGLPSISPDGRFVTYASLADNLIGPGNDNNGATDIFIHDRVTKVTTRVSVDSADTESDDFSFNSVVSGNGRFIAFDSVATNLVGADTNGVADVFLRDRDSDGNGIFDEAGGVTTTRISEGPGAVEGDGDSSDPTMSTDGQFIAYQSDATNLVANDLNGTTDIFVWSGGANTRVSVGTGGVESDGPSRDAFISGNGRFVSFESAGTNLVPADTNGAFDIFLRDRATATTARLTVDSVGTEADGDSSHVTLTSEGKWACWSTSADNLFPADLNLLIDVIIRGPLN